MSTSHLNRRHISTETIRNTAEKTADKNIQEYFNILVTSICNLYHNLHPSRLQVDTREIETRKSFAQSFQKQS